MAVGVLVAVGAVVAVDSGVSSDAQATATRTSSPAIRAMISRKLCLLICSLPLLAVTVECMHRPPYLPTHGLVSEVGGCYVTYLLSSRLPGVGVAWT